MQFDSGNPYPDSNPQAEGAEAPLRGPTRYLVIIGVLVLAVALGGLFGARPAYRWFKSQRARAFVEQGESLLASGDYDTAANKLRLALQLAPRDPEVLRLAARYFSRRGLAEGLNYWQILISSPDATREDLLNYIDLALWVNRLDLTGPQLHELLKKDPRDVEVLRRIIRHFRQSNHPAPAILTGREWLRSHPTDEEAQFSLGSLLHERGTNLAQIAEGRGLLWGLALGRGEYRDGALDILTTDAHLTRVENELLLKSLLERSPKGVSNRLQIATIRVRLDPASAPQLARELVRETPPELPPLQIALVANWLTDHRLGEEVMSLVPLESAVTNATLLSVRLRAAADMNRWDEVGPFLDNTNGPPIPATLRHCFLAQRDIRQGRLQTVPGHFENAVAACSNRTSEIEFVAAYAEMLHQPFSAIAAYERLLAYPPMALGAARKILALLAPLDDFRTQRETLRRLVVLLPGDPNIVVEESYSALVLGERLPNGSSTLAAMVQKDPSNLMIRSTLALAELRAGNAPAALSLLEAVEIDWSTADPRWQSIYAAVLGATQQRDAARQLARRVDRSRLKTEERLLVDPWL